MLFVSSILLFFSVKSCDFVLMNGKKEICSSRKQRIWTISHIFKLLLCDTRIWFVHWLRSFLLLFAGGRNGLPLSYYKVYGKFQFCEQGRWSSHCCPKSFTSKVSRWDYAHNPQADKNLCLRYVVNEPPEMFAIAFERFWSAYHSNFSKTSDFRALTKIYFTEILPFS